MNKPPKNDVFIPRTASFIDLQPTNESFEEAIICGLSGKKKSLPSKFFYDARGSRLFDEICVTPEYYPTRTEIGILAKIGSELANLIPERSQLIEFGAGNSTKVRLVLRAVQRFDSYVAIDISGEYLQKVANELASDFPEIKVTALCADYTRSFELPDTGHHEGPARVGFFPGSTIGNLTSEGAVIFLRNIGHLLGDGAGFIVGADLLKDEKTLLAAYNDSLGVTAAFNLNILHRINRELEANFVPEYFSHTAIFNPEKERMEMHLTSLRDQTVRLAGRDFHFAKDEAIHTENSHKYTIKGFGELLEAAGHKPLKSWTDPEGLFSVHFARIGIAG